MPTIFTHTRGPKKPKKKPGWQDAKYEHDQWLKSIQSTTLFSAPTKPKAKGKLPPKMPSLREKLDATRRTDVHSVISTEQATCTKKVHRPEIVYKDNPEMLERELKARERKFAVAPAYNKGGDQLVTDEFMKDITAGITRRR